MSEVFEYNEGPEQRGSIAKDLMKGLIEGIREASYDRVRPTTVGMDLGCLPRGYSRLFKTLDEGNPLNGLKELPLPKLGRDGRRIGRFRLYPRGEVAIAESDRTPDLDELLYNTRKRINENAKTTLASYRERLENIDPSKVSHIVTRMEGIDTSEMIVPREAIHPAWFEVDLGVTSREPVRHEHGTDAWIFGFDPGTGQCSRLKLNRKQDQASEVLFPTVCITPDVTDPDPARTQAVCEGILEQVRRQIATTMGLPTVIFEEAKTPPNWIDQMVTAFQDLVSDDLAKRLASGMLTCETPKRGMGRYYSESMVDVVESFYTFVET
jgi:hypothetical protein